MKVRVLYRGKPLAGAEVERGDGVTPMAEKEIPKFKTNKDGITEIPIVKTGAHLLAIDHKVVPARVPRLAKSDLYNATLDFVLPTLERVSWAKLRNATTIRRRAATNRASLSELF